MVKIDAFLKSQADQKEQFNKKLNTQNNILNKQSLTNKYISFSPESDKFAGMEDLNHKMSCCESTKNKQLVNVKKLRESFVSGTKTQGGQILPQQSEDTDAEIVYELDENGYLLDQNGNYILDDLGNQIQLSSEHIEYLRAANMLEEEFAEQSNEV